MSITPAKLVSCGALVVVAILGACPRLEDHTAAPPPPPTAHTAPSADTLDSLAMIATGHALDASTRSATIEALRSRSKTLEQVLDELVHDPGFANAVIPRMLLGELNLVPMSFASIHPLRSKVVDGQKVHFYRKPCAVADSVEVTPWWDRTKPIRICVADYKPDGFRTKAGYSCSGTMAKQAPECGCGQQLINCARDVEHGADLLDSLHRESTGTIARIVEDDRPFKEVFTTVYSLRERDTEYMRLRDKLYVGLIKEIPDLTGWPAEGKWAPREEFWPGAHSGILTTLQYLYMSDGPRDRMRLVLARTWCTTPGSFGVTSDQFRDLLAGHADIRSTGQGWKALAAAPGCTDCHARMDYGMQFFLGYPAIGTSVTPILADSRHAERGPMYMRDIDDPRGEAALTPRALGELIVSQPEFTDCMVTRVSDHVLGSSATHTDRATLKSTFEATGRMRPLFLAALRLFAERARTAPTPAPTPPVIASSTSPAPASIIVPPDLADRLLGHCGDCHKSGRHGFFAKLETTRSMSRELMLNTANLISFDLMPKDGQLPSTEKRALLEKIVEVLAPDPVWAANARAYWLHEWWGSRTHHMSAVKERLAFEMGYRLTPDDRLRSVEEILEGEHMTVTPAVITTVGQLALQGCRPLVSDPTRYRACLVQATRPDAFLVP